MIQSLSDALLGGLSGDSRMTDGIAPLRDIALLRGNKDSFMHKSKWYDNFIKDHLVKIQERGGTEAELAEQVLLIKENLWETAHKLEAGRLKEDDLKRMYQLFAGKGLKMSWLRRFARWGLSWHFNPAKKLFTFTGVEEQMRSVYSKFQKGSIDKNKRNKEIEELNEKYKKLRDEYSEALNIPIDYQEGAEFDEILPRITTSLKKQSEKLFKGVKEKKENIFEDLVN